MAQVSYMFVASDFNRPRGQTAWCRPVLIHTCHDLQHVNACESSIPVSLHCYSLLLIMCIVVCECIFGQYKFKPCPAQVAVGLDPSSTEGLMCGEGISTALCLTMRGISQVGNMTAQQIYLLFRGMWQGNMQELNSATLQPGAVDNTAHICTSIFWGL
jgi:hypothetical protein